MKRNNNSRVWAPDLKRTTPMAQRGFIYENNGRLFSLKEAPGI